MAVMLRTVVVFAFVGRCVSQATTTPAPYVAPAPDAVGKLSAAAAKGATAISVASVAGFVQGRQIAIGTPGSTEDATIATIVPGSNPPSITLTAALTKSHVINTPVVMHKIPAANPAAKPNKCSLKVPSSCKLPFNYKGVVYSTCTGTDAMSTLWCSEDSNYAGRWKACTDPCKGKWPVKKIVGSVVAGGIAATGIGLTAAAMAKSAKYGHFNPFYEGQKVPKASEVHTTGAPHLLQHTAGYDVWGEMVDVTTSAPARRLGQSLPGASVDLTATGTFGDVFAFIAMAVFLFGGIYSIRRLAAKKTNQKGSVAPEESNTPYIQA